MDWIGRFQRLCSVQFAEHEGGVFSFYGREFKPRDEQDDPRPVRHRENENNHEHLDIAPGHNAVERFWNNRKLADALELIWRDKLQMQFPGREFVLFVNNELNQVSCGETDEITGEEVYPTLRLWSRDDTTQNELTRIFRPHEATPHTVFDYDNPYSPLLKLDEVLSRLAAP